MRNHGKASFCVLDEGRPEQEGGWALRFRSVIVFGRLEEVEDHDRAIEITRALCHKFTLDENYIEQEIEHSGWRTMVVCLTPEHMTGKTVLES
jgi:nitroimidazol reductase NimA-like FMN-containing flavoprotein (pyridoxamine 5'-phosphate oxidase superfamily)